MAAAAKNLEIFYQGIKRNVMKIGNGIVTVTAGTWSVDKVDDNMFGTTGPAPAGGMIITSLIISTNDTAIAPNTYLYILGASGEVIEIGWVAVPTSAGLTTVVPPVDALANIAGTLTGLTRDPKTGKQTIKLEYNQSLKSKTMANMTAAKIVLLSFTAETINS